ncbi:4-alpha-N-acetylgalactosaminyltransferase [Flavobacterium sp. ACN2]|uniref:glycosyltransferase family 4 protein n=1 Tax=unclassified Flavobacterium TaxID=196869 RepID=UPI000BB315EE|nr:MULTISPECIES: glycosyltransferase family 4 protein [unclassified Flavobacterium]MDY0986474.1 glycosyltransferase family 4 protein [Flavobacterium sp. CFBP9031]PBI85712.1 4-alpha-N-acetylgalactosaminyltransferase [Flavobacterium sp. ACN2]
MKILNVTSMIDFRGGDSQMYTIYKLLADKMDLKQYILCPDKAVLAAICKNDNANFFTYPTNRFKLFSLILSIIKICKKESITVLHIHDSSSLTAALIALKFLNKSITLIFSRKRNNKIKDKFLNRYKYSHPRIHKIICVSKAVEAIFEKIVDQNRLITIYDAIDVEQFAQKTNQNLLHKEFNFAPETKIVGNIAALTSQKDIHTFIDTAKLIKLKTNTSDSIKFIVIGDGPLKEELVNYTIENNLEHDLFFTGYRNTADLLPEFNVFLLTSVTEGLPLTIYEAFACKIPVVCTKAGGTPEVITNGETGFLADLKDTETLSNSVLKIINNPALQEKIKTNAFQLVSQNHNLSIMQKNYYDFYKSLN